VLLPHWKLESRELNRLIPGGTGGGQELPAERLIDERQWIWNRPRPQQENGDEGESISQVLASLRSHQHYTGGGLANPAQPKNQNNSGPEGGRLRARKHSTIRETIQIRT